MQWDLLLHASGKKSTIYKEIPKFPEVRRDLALLIDTAISYSQIEETAFQTEKKLLKAVNLFDVYEGEKLEAGKKSYAVSLILQDLIIAPWEKNKLKKLWRNLFQLSRKSWDLPSANFIFWDKIDVQLSMAEDPPLPSFTV